jgi:hypothetical protein
MSVMEMSHRGKEYMSIAAEAQANVRELLAIPDNYKVLFMQARFSRHLISSPGAARACACICCLLIHFHWFHAGRSIAAVLGCATEPHKGGGHAGLRGDGLLVEEGHSRGREVLQCTPRGQGVPGVLRPHATATAPWLG